MDILKSKKFQAALIGLIVIVAKEFVPALDEVSITEMLMTLVAYIIGQGIADHGKEKAKIEKNGK